MKNVLRIIDLVRSENALLPEFGSDVFKAAHALLSQKEAVEFDFNGMRHVTTSFFHSVFGELFMAFPKEYDALVFMLNMDRPDWKVKYEDALELARNPERIEQIRRSMAEVMEG